MRKFIWVAYHSKRKLLLCALNTYFVKKGETFDMVAYSSSFEGCTVNAINGETPVSSLNWSLRLAYVAGGKVVC